MSRQHAPGTQPAPPEAPNPAPLGFSLVPSAYGDPEPAQVATFADLLGVLGTHRVMDPEPDTGGKLKTPKSCPGIMPCVFDGVARPNKRGILSWRADDSVVCVSFAALDIDKVTHEELASIFKAFDDYHTIVYTTFSHGYGPADDEKPESVSVRLFVELSRPASGPAGPAGNEWLACFKGLRAMTNGLIDEATKNPARLFYLPVRRPQATNTAIVHTPGKPLDVDALMKLGGEARAPAAPAGVQPPARIDDVEEAAAKMRRKASTALKAIGALIRTALDGHVYAEDGNRHNTLFLIGRNLGELMPAFEPNSIAEHFRKSIGATNARAGSGDEDGDVAKLAQMIEEGQANAETARIENMRAVREARTEARAETIEAGQAVADEQALRTRPKRIRDAFKTRNSTRDTPYTPEELATFLDVAGADTVEDLENRWIISRGEGAYVLFAGRYMAPVPTANLDVSARRDLAPADLIEGGVRLVDVDGDGAPFPKSGRALVAEYGTVARKSTVDLTAQATRYDPREQAIVEAPCPLRVTAPVYHEHVAAWLDALGGDRAEELRRWVAYVTDVGRPCVALMLIGGRNVGKSLLMKGLSRLWTTGGATDLGKIMGNFNAPLLECPLVFVDEHFPEGFIDKGTTRLRELIQSTTRTLNRKFMPEAQLLGAVRLIIAANNRDILTSQEDLNSEDIAATAERILFIEPDNERVRAVLESIRFSGGEERVNRMVVADEIAEHALWLRDQIGVTVPEPAGRFMVPTGEDRSHPVTHMLTTGSGIRSAVCHWLVGFLLKPTITHKNKPDLYVASGQLHVSSTIVANEWDAYPTNTRAPSVKRIGSALKGISVGQHRPDAAARLWTIDGEALVSWATDTGVASPEQIRKALRGTP